MAEALTLDDLLNAEIDGDIVQTVLLALAESGLPITEWQEGEPLLTLAEKLSISMQDLTQLVSTLARSGFVHLAESVDWLAIKAKSDFDLDRTLATFAEIHVRLTNGLASPYNITAGQLVLTATDGRKWISSNTTTEVLPASSTLDLDFKAEVAGSAYNVSFATPPTLTMETPLPSVTHALREVVDGDGAALGTYMTTAGADDESLQQLRDRCSQRWGTLSWAGPSLSYLAWAREASTAVKRVFVDDNNPSGPGTVDVYLAGDNGGVGGDDITAVDAVIQVRKPPTAVVTVQSITEDSVNFAATVYCEEGFKTAATAEIYAALLEYQRSVGIGDGAGAGRIAWSQVMEILMAPEGITRVNPSSLLIAGVIADYEPLLGHLAVFNPAQLTALLPTITFA